MTASSPASSPEVEVEVEVEPGPLLAVDAPWLLYRSYFGLPSSIKGAAGKPVNALLGSANALLATVAAYQPRAVAVCFGAEDAVYRVKLFDGYHAARDPMPADLAWQFRQARDLFAAFGWTVLDAGELEADDLLGSLARRERSGGGATLILTADRDMYQCVDDRTQVLHMKGGGYDRVDTDGVRSRYEVSPDQVPDFIALRGDPSDGIPGAPGIGAKTAASLLSRFGSLEALLADAESDSTELRPRLALTLRDNAARLRVFREVATLVEIDVSRPVDAELDRAAAAGAAAALGMGQLAGRLEQAV
jgi:5'-3' exonuclease